MESLAAFFLAILVASLGVESFAKGGTFVQFEGTDVTLGNDLFNVTFLANATAKSLFKNGVDLLANIDPAMQTWYLDWNGEKAYFNPTNVSVVNGTNEEAHVVFVQPSSPGLLYIEFHLVVLPNVSGLYQYVKASNPSEEVISLGEFRTVHRFDHGLMPKVSNIVRSGPTPNLTDVPTIQDTTWRLKDGTYWSKYDFCGYIRETPWFGVYGGGFGAWIVSASREYHSSGPLKQELLVHHNSLMLNYFHSGHFGTPGLATYPGWSKFYGPYLIYINTGSEEEVMEGAAKQAVVEQQQWPYKWVNDAEYPLARGSVTGNITGQTKAMVVVYDSTEEEFDLQTLGYTYNTETDENGSFRIDNIRPGNYQVVAYPLAGHGSENVARQNITVTAAAQVAVSLELPEPENIIWALGETNRRSDPFHYSDELRNFYWHLLPPVNLTFEINKSRIDKDWYYAQTRPGGVWKIKYQDKPDGAARVLRVAFAAASQLGSVDVEINGRHVEHYAYPNDQTLYRDAVQSGRFHSEIVTVPADRVIDGENVLAFLLRKGMLMYDTVSLAKAV